MGSEDLGGSERPDQGGATGPVDMGSEDLAATCPAGCAQDQVCDPDIQRCVACLEDNDCFEGVCDTSAGKPTCVACLEDTDCDQASGQVCEEASRACVACTDDDHCMDPTGRCDLSTFSCIECLDDDDCSQGVCDDTQETHACVACLEDADCDQASGQVCEEASRACVECTTDAECSGPNSRCDPSAYTCVECLEDADCPGGVCDPSMNACVQCLGDADCPDPGAARCQDKMCTGCMDDANCVHFQDEDLAVCDMGVCLGCRVAEEATDCGERACDPITLTCTDTERGTLEQGRRCRADSECKKGRCIELTLLDGSTQAYCLEAFDGMNPCPAGWQFPVETTSINGAEMATYCGVDTALTTPEAVHDYLSEEPCDSNDMIDDCGIDTLPTDGVCQLALDGNEYCTYPCSRNSECPGDCSNTSNTCQF